MKEKILSLVMLFSLVLTGCEVLGGSGTESDSETVSVGITETADTGMTDVQTQPSDVTDLFTADARKSLNEFRTRIADDQDMAFGTAFLGTCEGGYADVTAYIQQIGDDVIHTYPWLSEMPESRFFSEDGTEIYVVVPAEGWTLTVKEYMMDPNNDGLPAVGEMLYAGEDPVLLQGNISDLVPSFHVTLEKAGETIEYHPSLSLENGRLLGGEGVYDFTPYSQVIQNIGSNAIGERISGRWVSIYETAAGEEVLLYLNLSEDGLASYAYGFANSEMAETFGGTWSALGDHIALQLAGGIFDMEFGCVPEPYTLESVYSFNLIDSDTTLHLRLQNGISLIDGESGADLTFRCEGALGPAFDPYNGVIAMEADPADCVGEWYASTLRHDGYEMILHLSLGADGTASYRYGYGFNLEMCEDFSGTWSADTDGKLTLDLHGGSVTADVTDHYDFEAVFQWDSYDGMLSLYHESGNLLLDGTEYMVIGFAPFDFTLYDGEWVSYTEDGTVYRLQLISDGIATYSVEQEELVVTMYVGYWSIPLNEERLDLNMRLVMGEGDTVIRASYALDWHEFQKALKLRTTGGMALSRVMSETGEDVFCLIMPDAVG